jgi:hypothetical protein
MYLTPKKLNEFNKVLTSDPIKELVLWSDSEKEADIKNLLNRFSKLNEKLASSWSKIMKEPLIVDTILGRTDTEKFLQDAYIEQEGLQEKLPFVKKEKLTEIVDFPDFSGLISTIAAFNFSIQEAKNHGITLQDLLTYSKDGLTDSMNKLIQSESEVKIQGWENIQKYLSIVIYVEALNRVLKTVKHPMKDFNGYLSRINIFQVTENKISLNLENLRQKMEDIH